MDRFLDLGAGWLLYDDESERLTVVCDTSSPQPNHFFGPAAWDGKDGPVSGLTILEALPVLGGRWEQTGREEWQWFCDDGRVLDDAPDGWPRRIEVCDSPAKGLLETLAGLVVSTESELADLLHQVTLKLPKKELPSFSASARLEYAKFMHPHVFGDLDCTPEINLH